MAKKNTISNASINWGTSNTNAGALGNVTFMGNSTGAAYPFSGSPVNNTINTPVPKKRGWPKRHMRRCWWYFRLIRVTYHLNTPENDDKLFKVDPLNNPKYWSEHELEILARIRKDLADLYNNRFIEYKKMIAEEKGYELPEIINTNKYIMK